MKAIIITFLIAMGLVSCTVQAPLSSQTLPRKGGTQQKNQGISNSVSVPNGTYYILQVASGKAVTPKGITQITNEIYLQPFNKGGLQKWIIKKQPSGQYILQPEGNTDLYFTTFADSPHWTAITANRIGDTYLFKPVSGTETSFTIHSKYYNGDALKSTTVGGYEEIKFAPLEHNSKFYWLFIPVE